MVQEKALDFPVQLHKDGFKASNDWMQKFRSRHSITVCAVSGEAGDVTQTTGDDWIAKLPDLIHGYAPLWHLQHG